MKPDSRFVGLPKSFWAHIRAISEQAGYTDRKTGGIKVPSVPEIEQALAELAGSPANARIPSGPHSGVFLTRLAEYFRYRATTLNDVVRPLLMDAKAAQKLFREVRASLHSQTPVPLNKQKGKKKKPAFLTGLVNMLVDAHRQDMPCDLDPRQLTRVVRAGLPLRTLARRVDGAFPSAINPVAIWEVKEYYQSVFRKSFCDFAFCWGKSSFLVPGHFSSLKPNSI